MLLAIGLSSFPPSSGYHEKNIHHMDALNLDSCLWFHLPSHILRMWLGLFSQGWSVILFSLAIWRVGWFYCTGCSFFMDGGLPKVQSSMVRWSLRGPPKDINTISIRCRIFLFSLSRVDLQNCTIRHQYARLIIQEHSQETCLGVCGWC